MSISRHLRQAALRARSWQHPQGQDPLQRDRVPQGLEFLLPFSPSSPELLLLPLPASSGICKRRQHRQPNNKQGKGVLTL